jgi:peptide chain release factor 1
MDDLTQAKIQELIKQLDGLEDQLGQPDLFSNPKQFRELTRQHSHLSHLKELWDNYQSLSRQLVEAKEILREELEPEFIVTIEEEIESLQPKIEKLKLGLEQAIVPPDPYDNRNTIMELRAGTGGDEAALFVGDCVRMYQLYADSRGWNYEVLSASQSERGGYKEFIMVLSGSEVYKYLRHEAGTHRVQRVPETEAQGRVHTSAITVAVMPEPDEEEEIHLDEKDLRIDTMRASGAGGQHVNTTDSAVRMTHIPTGLMVYCQQERSQIKNRDKAMRLLQAKLNELEKDKRAKVESDMRSSQIGSGDRSERIRTYNFPQNRITDHRIELTLYNLNYVINGDLQCLAQPLVLYFHNQRLEKVLG